MTVLGRARGRGHDARRLRRRRRGGRFAGPLRARRADERRVRVDRPRLPANAQGPQRFPVVKQTVQMTEGGEASVTPRSFTISERPRSRTNDDLAAASPDPYSSRSRSPARPPRVRNRPPRRRARADLHAAASGARAGGAITVSVVGEDNQPVATPSSPRSGSARSPIRERQLGRGDRPLRPSTLTRLLPHNLYAAGFVADADPLRDSVRAQPVPAGRRGQFRLVRGGVITGASSTRKASRAVGAAVSVVRARARGPARGRGGLRVLLLPLARGRPRHLPLLRRRPAPTSCARPAAARRASAHAPRLTTRTPRHTYPSPRATARSGAGAARAGSDTTSTSPPRRARPRRQRPVAGRSARATSDRAARRLAAARRARARARASPSSSARATRARSRWTASPTATTI